MRRWNPLSNVEELKEEFQLKDYIKNEGGWSA